MATQNRDIYSAADYAAVRDDFTAPSLAGHVGSVMEAGMDDVKSVVEYGGELVTETVRSAGRDVMFFIAGAIFTLVVIVISRFF